ncbi:MAG TPA: hypothetical protein VHX44_11560 [Planctomycetota bacterium]|nr:hypothetical protein [Planctomycetota bacterium]
MRALVLLLVVLGTGLWCDDYQKLTFSDGKVLVGYFNERTGTVTLDDGKTVAVKVDDIIRREPAVREKEKLKIPPPVQAPTDDAPQPTTSALPAATVRELLSPIKTLHQTRRQ